MILDNYFQDDLKFLLGFCEPLYNGVNLIELILISRNSSFS